MPKPLSRKETIRRKAKDRIIEVQSRKIKGMSSNINNLDKRLKALENQGGPN
jgi:hypothetical protein